MRRFAPLLLAVAFARPISLSAQTPAAPAPTAGPTLRALVGNLFKFGECGEALCLQVNAAVHGLHFAPSAQAASGTLIGFFTDAIGNSVSNIPISSASGGVTFSFRGGAPVKTSVSTGPIFAERAATVGRGRLVVGANVTSLNFTTFRGLPLNNLEFNFTHQNVGSPVYGDPLFENDVIQVHANVDLNLLVTTASLTYGLLDNLDVGVAVPIVRASLNGTSIGTIIPFGENSPHMFGTPDAPTLSSTGSAKGSSFGIGDVALRAKLNLSESKGLALFGDVRLPTGDPDQLSGSGSASVRAMGVYSHRYHDMTPHVNLGLLVRTATTQKNAVISALGFDQLVSESITIAFDVLGEIQIGENAVAAPKPVQLDVPYVRTITPTNLPNSRDNVIRAAFGMKYTTKHGLTALLNALVPVRAGGLQPAVAWTAGLEYSY
jgi:hypothetical protein